MLDLDSTTLYEKDGTPSVDACMRELEHWVSRVRKQPADQLTYSYVASKQLRSGGSTILKGKVAACSQQDASRMLEKLGLTAIQVRTETDKKPRLVGRRRPDAFCLVSMTRRFASMLQAGLPFMRVLDALTSQEEDAVLKAAMGRVSQRVYEGATLSQAFGRQNGVFPPMYISMLAIGESTGKLSETLHQLATFLERDLDLSRRARSAMVYPAVVLVCAIGLMLALFKWVLPPLLASCSALSDGSSLPLPTLIVGAIVSGLQNYALLAAIVGALGAAVWAGRAWYQRPSGRLAIDRLKLTLPVLGPLNLMIVLTRLCNSWAILNDGGHPILQTVQQLGQSVDNAWFRESVLVHLHDGLTNGLELQQCLKRGNRSLVPSLLISMVTVGEQSGNLSLVLQRLAHLYNEEVRTRLEGFLGLVEPLMMAVMGSFVLLVLLSVFLPLYQLVTRL